MKQTQQWSFLLSIGCDASNCCYCCGKLEVINSIDIISISAKIEMIWGVVLLAFFYFPNLA